MSGRLLVAGIFAAVFSFESSAQLDMDPLLFEQLNAIQEAVTVVPINYTDLDSVERNAKFELGVFLPQYIEDQVMHFIEKDAADRCNPFDPRELSVEAFFTHEKGGEVEEYTAYGFYYEDYVRNPSMRAWSVRRNEESPMFRVRFAPRETGNWTCKVVVKLREKEELLASETLHFQVVDKGHVGFVRISDNKQYLEVDGELFLPVGMNLPTIGGLMTGYQKEGAVPSEYLDYHHALEELKSSGGNYLRYMHTPWTTEIEFEHLGDYSNRLAQAWEMDAIFDKMEELDLRMHFNLSYTPPLTYTGVFSLYRWDWTNAKDTFLTCDYYPNWVPDDPGYCYHTDSVYGVEKIDEFFEDPDLIRFYQNRLRYIIARWGYSTQIVTYELMNEINFSGVRYGVKPDCGFDPTLFEHKPYFHDTSYVRKLSSWQIEMGRYIKEDLQHFDHPYCVNYGGTPNYVPGDNYRFDYEDGISLEAGDHTYFSEYIDIITFNEYFRWLEKYQYELQDRNKLRDYYKRQVTQGEELKKPFFYSELGMGRHGCDNRFTYKQLFIMSPFSGAMGAGLPWHFNNNSAEFHKTALRKDAWSTMKVIRSFFEDVPLLEGEWHTGFDVRKDKKAELLFLRDSESSAQRAVAVINNRTVNRFTMREDWCDDQPELCDCYLTEEELTRVFPKVYQTAEALEWNEGRKLGGSQLLKLSGMEYTSRYRIVYYDGMTGDTVMEDTKWSDALGNLKLRYPKLAATPYKEGEGSNGSMLLVKIMKVEFTSLDEKNEGQ